MMKEVLSGVVGLQLELSRLRWFLLITRLLRGAKSMSGPRGSTIIKKVFFELSVR